MTSGKNARKQRSNSPKMTLVNAGRYEWPIITALHPEHGAYRFDLHGIAHPDGLLTLIACDNGLDRRKKIDMAFATAAGVGGTVIELQEADVSDRLALIVAAHMHAEEGKSEPSKVLILPGAEYDLYGAGRREARYPSTFVTEPTP